MSITINVSKNFLILTVCVRKTINHKSMPRILNFLTQNIWKTLLAVADPGFPRGGGANSPGGAPTYDFTKLSQKLHKIERIWTPGGRPKFYYVDPPLTSVLLSFRNVTQLPINAWRGLLYCYLWFVRIKVHSHRAIPIRNASQSTQSMHWHKALTIGSFLKETFFGDIGPFLLGVLWVSKLLWISL